MNYTKPVSSINDIVSVQPMKLPSGLIFYLDYNYGTKVKVERKVLTDPIEILMRKIGYDV